MKAFHDSWNLEYREPFGAATVGSVVSIAIDVEASDSTEVILRTWQNWVGESRYFMKRNNALADGQSRFAVEIEMPRTGGLLWYYFVIKEGENTYYYGNNDDCLGGEGILKESEPASYQITVYKESAAPEWFKNGIVYQIFPDRYARDDDWKIRTEYAIETRNRVLNSAESQKQFIEEDWNRPAYYIKDEEGNVTEWPFYGGSLKGIENKLDYIKSYGVTTIYLNPIFKAVSNHRYDTADYMTIDPILGTEEDFRSLLAAAKDRGISIVLDGVFSHTGADSIYFDKYLNYGGIGAYNNENSQYKYWYKFNDSEIGYSSWWGIKDLPEVDENNAFYRQMICGENGVIKKWLRAGARGWRLDVADELPDSFIKDIRNSIKSENADNILIGEVWEDASNKVSYDEQRKYLMGDELDSTMNYPLRQILLDYVNYTISSKDACRRIMNLKENYPKENFYAALNLIGSHDRKRILSMMAAEEDYNAAASKLKLLATLQYALPGVPSIYYGDEVGMMGDNDPENRNGFPWDDRNLDIAYHFRMLGLIYRDYQALKDGEIEFLYVDNDDVVAFTRFNKNHKLFILTNRSYNSTTVCINNIESFSNKYALDLLTSSEVDLNEITLERLSSRILLILDKAPELEKGDRAAGVICHISSLPGGKLGKGARDFVDWIASAGMKVWQILPLNPNGIGDCPYNSYSAFAGNPDFINYDELPDNSKHDEFCKNNEYWLKDYLDYMSDKDKVRLKLLKEQYYFYCQWNDLKQYANRKGVRIMGDLPMFISADSADVKCNPEIFITDEDGRLSVNAGVPPDDFSDEGQNWGSALYDWKVLKETGYKWWINRLKQCAERYDILRLDHFRAFSEYYAIPAGKSAKEGSWQNGPGIEFFDVVGDALKKDGLELEILAEDLGLLDAGVKNLIKLTGYPGMDIWQFSADEMLASNEDYQKNRAYYSGTHDNQTLMGWIAEKYPELSLEEAIEKACEAIEWMFKSSAKYAIVQLQDMFLLDDSARMNVPGIAEGNWKWAIPGNSIQEAFLISEEVATWYNNLVNESNR